MEAYYKAELEHAQATIELLRSELKKSEYALHLLRHLAKALADVENQ